MGQPAQRRLEHVCRAFSRWSIPSLAQHPKHGVLYSQGLRLVIGFPWVAHGIRHTLQQIDILNQPRHLFFLERLRLWVTKKKSGKRSAIPEGVGF